MIVIDASAVLDFLLRTPRGIQVERRLLEGPEHLNAPHLIDLETTQVLRRYTMSGEITETRAHEALMDFIDFPIERYPHEPFLSRIWELRHNLTCYDAAYVSLAESLEATLITSDRRLSAAPLPGLRIEVIGG